MKRPVYRCAMCGRRLKVDRCIYSSWTRQRYCWPGEGCSKNTAKRKGVRA